MKKINTIKNFKDVKDYYYITTCGKIIGKKGKLLKTCLDKHGYEKIVLKKKDNTNKTINIHRIVALAFIPNTENKPQVNHIDEVKTHNYIGNLEWMTAEENNIYGTRIKRCIKSKKGKYKGENNRLYGKHLSEETKQKISKALIGKPKSEETKQKISKTLLGKYTGSKNPNAKSKEYYSINSVVRHSFKKTCERMCWDFNDFIEVYSGESCGHNKKYYYIFEKSR